MASKKLIWVVDDQADFRFLLQQIFTRYAPAYPVRFFDSGQTLLREMVELGQKPSLILLDRHMPGVDGYQTLLALKSQPAYKLIPVVMMSAEASTTEINACYEAGVNSFLLKRLDFYALKAMIEGICQYWLDTNQQPAEI